MLASLAASAATASSRDCCTITPTALNTAAKTSITAGRTRAHSAVIPPRSRGKAEGTAHQVGENFTHLVALHDDDEKSGKPDGSHRGDGVFRRRRPLICSRSSRQTIGDVCVGVFHGVCPFQSGRCCRVATRAEWQFARAHGARCASRIEERHRGPTVDSREGGQSEGGRTRPPSVRRALTTAPVGPVEALPPRG